MKAVIMAGGMGTRLKPLTCQIPKPLAKIAGKCCVLYVLDLLLANGIQDACLTLMYMGEKIIAELEDIRDMNLSFYTEREPLGTAGSVRNCADFLAGADDFMVISGDCVCDFDLSRAVEYHKSKGGIATIVLTKVKEPLEYGVAVTSPDGSISRFIEKPSWSRAYSDMVNTGIYIFSPRIFDYFPEVGRDFKGNCDFSKDIFPKVMSAGEKIYGFQATGYWCDVGNLEAYMKCNNDVLSGAVSVKYALEKIKNEAYVVPDGSHVIMPSYIGKNVVLKNSQVGPFAVLCDGCKVENATVERSVLLDGVTVEQNASVRGSVVCENAKVHSGASVGERSVIGAESVVGHNSVVGAGAKVYPKNIIPEYSFIRSNILGGIHNLTADEEGFGDIFDESLDLSVFVRAGASAADILKRDIAVAVCKMGKNLLSPALAVCSGVICRGVNVFEAGRCDINTFRFAVKNFNLGGGIFIKESDGKIFLTFLESDGLYFCRENERKLELALSSGEMTFGENGKLRELRAFDGVYMNKIRSLLENLSPEINVSGTKYFANSIKRSISPSNEYMRVSPDNLVVQTPRKEAYPDDVVKCVAAFCLGKITGKVAIPYDYPAVLTSVAEKNGFVLIRTTLEDKDRSLLFGIYDTNIKAAAILKYMSENECSFADILSKLPPFSSRRREISIKSDKAALMRELTAEKNCEMIEGVRLSEGRGTVLIVPKKSEGTFKIFAEASDAETAAEICDFYVKKLRNR